MASTLGICLPSLTMLHRWQGASSSRFAAVHHYTWLVARLLLTCFHALHCSKSCRVMHDRSWLPCQQDEAVVPRPKLHEARNPVLSTHREGRLGRSPNVKTRAWSRGGLPEKWSENGPSTHLLLPYNTAQSAISTAFNRGLQRGQRSGLAHGVLPGSGNITPHSSPSSERLFCIPTPSRTATLPHRPSFFLSSFSISASSTLVSSPSSFFSFTHNPAIPLLLPPPRAPPRWSLCVLLSLSVQPLQGLFDPALSPDSDASSLSLLSLSPASEEPQLSFALAWPRRPSVPLPPSPSLQLCLGRALAFSSLPCPASAGPSRPGFLPDFNA
eukprot:2391039-Rhodomonas_salina.1